MRLAMQYLGDIQRIGLTQSISFVFFFGFFLFVLYYVFTTKKSYYEPISEMPLDDETDIKSYSDNKTE